jgi:cytochrome c
MNKAGDAMRTQIVRVAMGASLAVFVVLPVAAADVEHGKTLFQACAACHTDGPDSLGPNLKGVFGRKSAVVEDFRYSAPMVRANLVWDEANLRDYLTNPQAKVKGNRMPYGGVTDPKDVDDIIAYLKTLK